MLRYGKARGLRRVVRPGRGPTGAALVGRDASQTTFQAILGGLFVDQWVRESGANAASWTSQGTRVLPAVNTPTFAPDGANFRGASVVGTTVAGPNSMKGTGLTALAVSGARPYMMSIGRFVVAGGPQKTLLSLGDATTDQVAVFSNAANFFGFLGGIAIPSAGAADTSVHSFEVWADGVSVFVSVDGVDASGISAAAIAANLTVGVIGNAIGASLPADGFVSRIIVASSVPTSGQRAAMLALARSLDGF